MSKYATIKKFNIANGPGIRTAIFFSGCNFHCKECFNPELWDPEYGTLFTYDTLMEIFDSVDNDHIVGLSILGGEPLSDFNLETVTFLCKEFKKEFPNKTIWLWSGFTIEKLNSKQKEILEYIDVLVDGQFEINKRDYNLMYRGSSNQRVLYKGKDF